MPGSSLFLHVAQIAVRDISQAASISRTGLEDHPGPLDTRHAIPAPLWSPSCANEEKNREHDDHLANTSRAFPARFGQKKALFPTRNNGLCSRKGELRVIPAGDPVTRAMALAAPDGRPRTVDGDRRMRGNPYRPAVRL